MGRKPRYINHGRDFGPNWRIRKRLVVWYLKYCDDDGTYEKRRLPTPWKVAR